MSIPTLQAIDREKVGKGAARSLRRDSKVPVVLYGNKVETSHHAVDAKELDTALLHHARVIVLAVEGKEPVKAVIREIQRHPVSEEVRHVDLLAVQDEDVVTLRIPVRHVGNPVGVKQGGQLRQLITRLEIRCKAVNIPSFVEVDITNLEAGRNMLVKDLPAADYEFVAPPHVAVMQITKPRDK